MSIFTSPDWRDAAQQEYHKKRQALVERAERNRRQLESLEVEIAALAKEVDELDQAARTFGLPGAKTAAESMEVLADRNAEEPKSDSPQFKDVALDLLRGAFPRTLTAAQIGEKAERMIGRPFHPKTAGMTLYRLSKEGLVKRIGRADWRYVPQEGESSEADASEPSSLFS